MFNVKMSNENNDNQVNKKIYDLEERTAKFGEDVIEFVRKVPKDVITIPLIEQLIKSGTSVGANYNEADCAESKKDFEHKLGISKKEAKESKHWLRMISKAVPNLNHKAKIIWKEANELQLIFISIIKKSRSKIK